MERTAQQEQTQETSTTQTPRTRRGRGRRRVGRWVKPVYPMRAYYEMASEQERRQAHLLSAIILEYWTGVKTKSEAAAALSVPPIRVWQMSQRAATGLVCALLTPPSGRRGAPMASSAQDQALAKENARLEKENRLLRELVSVLRELPGNRERDLPPALQQAAKEAEAAKPRKRKSRGPRSVPPSPGVAAPPSS